MFSSKKKKISFECRRALCCSECNSQALHQMLHYQPVPSVAAECQWLKAQHRTAYSPGSSMTSQPTNLLTERRLCASSRPSVGAPEPSYDTRNTRTHKSNRWLSAVSHRLQEIHKYDYRFGAFRYCSWRSVNIFFLSVLMFQPETLKVPQPGFYCLKNIFKFRCKTALSLFLPSDRRHSSLPQTHTSF